MESLDNESPINEHTPLYSSIIILTYLKMIKARYAYVNVTALLLYAGMEMYEVEDEGHWFTQQQVDLFYERLVTMTGNANIAREAGRYTASPDALGKTTRWVLGFIDPATVYRLIGKIAGRYTRSSVFSSRKISDTEIEMIVTPRARVVEKKYQCENRKGYFEAIVSMFYNRLPRITHPECVFEGGTCCRYRISWRRSPAELFKRNRNYSFLASLVGIIFFAIVRPWSQVWPIGVVAACYVAVLSLIAEILEKREIKSALLYVRSTTEELLDKMNVNYNHALMINEIGRIVSMHHRTETLLTQVVEIFRHRLEYDRGLIMLVDDSRRFLEYKASYGYGPDTLEEIEATRFHLDREESRGIFVLCYREQRPFLINDIETIKDDLSTRSLELVKKIGSKAFICCPIIYENQCIGVLAVDNITSHRPLLESDKNLLMGIAPEIGVSIRNAIMTEERESQFRSILRVLAATIDARDSLTAGHSERVTEYSIAICREMDLPTEYTEMIRVASQLHDYGKIGIQDSVLKKTGPLSESERKEIETHVVKTRQILDQINFKGVYQQVPAIAGAHHEHIDGSGYPDGLRGEEIPLGSRIIAVADFFEAITAQRHYRDPMTYNDAIAALKEASGKNLDAHIVEVFLRILKRSEFPLPAETDGLGAAVAIRPHAAGEVPAANRSGDAPSRR